MKPSTILYALGLGELALAMPVPMTISDMLSHVQDEAHRLTRVSRVSMRRLRPVAIIQDSAAAEDDSYPSSSKVSFIEFDNQSLSPSRALRPSVVLAIPRPLKTDYLQSLAKHPQSGGKEDRLAVVDVVGDGTPETIRPMTLTEGLAGLMPSKDRMPCWKHVRVPQPTMAIFEQHPDLIVLGAVIALVLVLLVLETVGTTFQGVRSHYTLPEGQIRLEGDEKPCKAPSFRFDMEPFKDAEEELERHA